MTEDGMYKYRKNNALIHSDKTNGKSFCKNLRTLQF